MEERAVCPHCGEPEEYEGSPEHRSCRLKAAFPGAYSKEGAIVTFDMQKVREALNLRAPYRTSRGLEFHRMDGDSVLIVIPVRVANTVSTWSWYIAPEEWDGIVEAMERQKASRR